MPPLSQTASEIRAGRGKIRAMYWRDEQPETVAVTAATADDVVDVSFAIRCAQLPGDHALPLHRAVARVLPWLADEPRAAIHSIFGAASGNGWRRPDVGEVQLSRRTRLVLRVPRHRAAEADALGGHTLEVGGNPLAVGAARIKPLAAWPVLYARSVADHQHDESAFSAALLAALRELRIDAPKVLCGLTHHIATGDPAAATIRARSVLLADLTAADSLRLQQHGVFDDLNLGCGIFTPYKRIGAVRRDD